MKIEQLTYGFNAMRSFRRCGTVLGNALLSTLLFHSTLTQTYGAMTSNVQSPLGMNVATVSQYSMNSPFLNIAANNGGGWTTIGPSYSDTGEEADLQLDSNGYVKSMVASPMPAGGQKFTSVQITLNSS